MKAWKWIGKNRGFALGCLFLGVNTLGIVWFNTAAGIGRRAPAVEFHPGEEAAVTGSDPLRWRFSEPMVATGRVGRIARDVPVSLRPHFEGGFSWEQPDCLVFRPSRPWPLASRFEAVLDRDFRGLSGRRPTSGRTFHFRANPPRMLSVRQIDCTEKGNVSISLLFNQEVSPLRVEKHLQVLDGGNRPLKWSLKSEEISSALALEVEPTSWKSLKLVLRKGFQAEHGPLASESDQELTLELERDLVLASLSAQSPSYGNPGITVRFSRGIDLDSLRSRIRVEPAVPFTIEERSRYHRTRYEIRGEFEPGGIYTLSVAAGVKSHDGRVRLAEEIRRRMFIPDREPDLRIRLKGHYLSPQGSMTLPLRSMNLHTFKIRAVRVIPANLVHYAMREAGHYSRYYGRPEQGLGEKIAERSFTVRSDRNEILEHGVSLRDLLPSDPQGIYVLSVSRDGSAAERRLVAITDTGITARQSRNQLVVWANSIHSLEAVSQATVTVWSRSNQQIVQGKTDRDGLARLTLPPDAEKPFLVTVKKGADRSFLDLEDTRVASQAGTGTRPYPEEDREAFVYSDRGVYRPGETAHVRAIVRGPGLECPQGFPVELKTLRPDGRSHSSTTALLSASGTAEFRVSWANYDATGRYRLRVGIPGGERALGETRVSVEEFVPPRMLAECRLGTNTLQAGDSAELRVRARYLYGAPASGNRVSVKKVVVPIPFQAEAFSGYHFGDQEKAFSPLSKKIASGHLDDDGTARFRIETDAAWRPPAQLRALLNVEVMEQGGRTVTTRTECRIHPYPFYIGLRIREPGTLQPGGKADLEIALVTPAGRPARLRPSLELNFRRISWSTVLEKDRHGHYHYESVRTLHAVHTATLSTSPEGRATQTLNPGGAGAYLLSVRDPQSGASSSMKLYVGAGQGGWRDRSMEKPDRLELTLDKPEYDLGDTAQLTVIAPFAGKALLSVEQNDVLDTMVRETDANQAVFHIPVTSRLGPNAHLSVSVIRPVGPTGNQDVYRATGSTLLRLNPRPLRLVTEISCPPEIRPRSRLEIQVSVRDAVGQGRVTELALAAVDEGICMLTDFKTPDPLDFFTAPRRNGVLLSDLYAHLMPEPRNPLAPFLAHTGGDMASLLSGRLNPVTSRRFKPVALWKSGILTDSNGQARVALDVPEFSGTLRIMAVAVAPRHFGSAETRVRVRRPVTLLHSLPRFLAPGDRCALPVQLHNATGREGVAVLEVDGTGPVTIQGPARFQETLEPDQRVSFNFTLQALESTGTATLRLRARLGEEVVRETIEIAVRPASSLRSVSGSLAIPAGQSREVDLPDEWIEGTGRYALQLSGLPGVKLKAGLDYLLDYPYGCLEQTVSASFPLLYLADLVNRPESPLHVEDASAQVQAGIRRVLSMQLANGGFGYWPQMQKPYAWGSVYALHFLVEARRAGHVIQKNRLEAGIGYLRGLLERKVVSPGDLQSEAWREDANLRAYACHVLALADRPEHGWTARLREQRETLSGDSRMHLVLALAAAGLRRDARDELRTLGEMSFEIVRKDGDSLASAAGSSAMLLSTWLEMWPESPDLPLLVRKVERFRHNGCWHTTRENALALMALGKYLHRTAGTPRSCRGYIEKKREGDEDGKRLVFRVGDRPERMEPAKGGTIRVHNEGPGTLYCGWMAAGIPAAARDDEIDQGLAVRREYRDRHLQPLDITTVKQGELLVVVLSLDTFGAKRDNLVLEDLLPAGFEIENAALKTSSTLPGIDKKSNLPLRHREIRDDRIVLFPEAFRGKRIFFYTVRAVTPGTYQRPPVSASSMYIPGLKSIHGGGHTEVVNE